MQIEHCRPVFCFKATEGPLGVKERKYPEPPAARSGHVPAHQFHSRRWKLQQPLSMGRGVEVWVSAGTRNSIQIVLDREDTGVVGKPFFDENIQRPETCGSDRPGRRAVSGDANRGSLLNRIAGGTSVRAEFGGCKRADFSMPVAVAGHLMPAFVYL